MLILILVLSVLGKMYGNVYFLKEAKDVSNIVRYSNYISEISSSLRE